MAHVRAPVVRVPVFRVAVVLEPNFKILGESKRYSCTNPNLTENMFV